MIQFAGVLIIICGVATPEAGRRSCNLLKKNDDAAKRIEYFLLSSISDSGVPLGAGTLSGILKGNDIEISEATVGRYLKTLERNGYLSRVSFRGREVTERGLERIARLRDDMQQINSLERMLLSIRANGGTQLKNLLCARLVIEPENAALAAIHSTKNDLLSIRKVLEEMDKLKERGESVAATDSPFHMGIARASGNPVLEFMMKIIRVNQDFSPVIEHIRKITKGKIESDHWKIYRAIEDRNSNHAKEFMRRHIESMISEFEEYKKIGL